MLISLAPGRSLRWSPPWPCSDAVILFDANSGDYWVLSAEGKAMVTALEHEGALDMGALLTQVGGARDDAETLVQELARSGIITPLATGAP